jgi:hypothetical protein
MDLALMVLPLMSPALTQVIPDVAQREFVSALGVRQFGTRGFNLATPVCGLFG